MNEIWLILHLFGFGAAVTSSVGNGIILMLLRASPGDAPVLTRVPPRLGRVGQAGLGLLWITGIIMVWSVFGGPQNLPAMFWWKFVCVLVVTAGVAVAGLALKQIQAGNRAVAARLPLIAAVNAVFLVLVVVFAVYSFD